MYYYNNTCLAKCPNGTVLLNSKCVPIDCTKGYMYGPNGTCIPNCGPNQQYSNGICQCIDNYFLINSRCQQCPNGSKYNFRTLECEQICGINSIFYVDRCYCLKGFYLINGSCQSCLNSYQFN